MFASVIILAAGASRRMGSPKALLRFDGETCLSLVLSAAAGSMARESILVIGADGEAIRAVAPAGGGLRIVVNERHDRGQTSSLKAGLDAISGQSEAFAVIPVDQPLIRREDVDALITAFEPRPRGRTIFVASHEGRRGHPVLFSSSHRSPILEMSDDDPLSGYIRLREAEVGKVEIDNPGVVIDMNTPEEYEKALRIYRARAAGASRAGDPGDPAARDRTPSSEAP